MTVTRALIMKDNLGKGLDLRVKSRKTLVLRSIGPTEKKKLKMLETHGALTKIRSLQELSQI